MPPKVKITEEQILDASIEIIRSSGWHALNARSIAQLLGCSTQPLFRTYKNMEELKQAVWKKAQEQYNACMIQGMNEENGFLNMGLNYIRFAAKEPNLFQYLFMSEAYQVNRISDMVENEEDQQVVAMISKMADIDHSEAQNLYVEIWLITHGIASFTATNGYKFSEDEVRRILGDAFNGFLGEIKKRKKENSYESEINR